MICNYKVRCNSKRRHWHHMKIAQGPSTCCHTCNLSMPFMAASKEQFCALTIASKSSFCCCSVATSSFNIEMPFCFVFVSLNNYFNVCYVVSGEMTSCRGSDLMIVAAWPLLSFLRLALCEVLKQSLGNLICLEIVGRHFAKVMLSCLQRCGAMSQLIQ